jgi:hypothetical protein
LSVQRKSATFEEIHFAAARKAILFIRSLQESSRHRGVFKIIYYEQGYTPVNT